MVSLGNRITEFQRIISIRVPEINKDQNLLRNYYYSIIEQFLPKSKKNIEILQFTFDEVENFFIIINDVRFIIKCDGEFYGLINHFENYLFNHLLSKSTFNMTVDLIPVMLTPEDKEKMIQRGHQIKNLSQRYEYWKKISIYRYIDDYFVLRITTSDETFIIDEIQN